MNLLSQSIAANLSLPPRGVDAVVELLDEGATVPFISRYRKERTGALDEVAVRAIESELGRLRELEKRRAAIIEAVDGLGLLSDELRARFEQAATATDLEDLYAPYKPRRRTRATIAREKGYEPLAKKIMTGHMNSVDASAEAIEGACDIIAEWASDTPRLRNRVRNTFRKRGTINATAARGKDNELKTSPYAMYAGFSRRIGSVPSHQILALRRAEREGLLTIRYTIDNEDELIDYLADSFVPHNATDACYDIAAKAVADSYKRLLKPSIENEIASELKEQADKVAIDIFASNLRQLLLAPPLRGCRVLALDPGFRTGCKVAALDEQGNLLADTTIYPTEPRRDIAGATKTLTELIRRHRLETIALGNGTASRETEAFLKNEHILDASKIFVVSESGASVYSASDIARKEMPDKDVTVRGAVSIGRRLIDPLAELVKIDPKAIGVGQYQHDVDQHSLKDSLDYTVMSCVNAVGVDVNTASEQLLSYISGIGPLLAKNIVAYRAENGPYRSRTALKAVPRMGDKAFELSAGFLRVPISDNVLDNTGIHPESYTLAAKIAGSVGATVEELASNAEVLGRIDVDALVSAGTGGRETMTDIIAELRKPGRDPRTDSGNDAFTPGISDFSELHEGMVLEGVINNITAFGAFVDLGIHESGLVHISEISKRRIASVGDAVKIGQKVNVKVIGIDEARHRISLSMKQV